MFMPMASPVEHLNRRKTLRPAMCTEMLWSFAKREVLSKEALNKWKLDSMNCFICCETRTEGECNTGARDMPSPTISVLTPPPSDNALHPRVVDATSAPSVVAMGTKNSLPSMMMGPATPTGIGA
jgi:hypothetical protein